jgi:thiol-disulfide isomerase/thioredoxin
MKTRTVLIVAALAAALGAIAGLTVSGPGPLWRSALGQKVLQNAIEADAPAPPAGVTVAREGDAIPTLRLPDLDGRAVEVPEAWRGRPLLINVWASWCGPCIEEMPELQRFDARQGDDGVQVIGIALDEPDAVRAFLQRVPVDYPILIDAPGPADAGVRLGNVKGVLPYSVLIGRDGRMLRRRIGPFVHGELEGFVGDADR